MKEKNKQTMSRQINGNWVTILQLVVVFFQLLATIAFFFLGNEFAKQQSKDMKESRNIDRVAYLLPSLASENPEELKYANGKKEGPSTMKTRRPHHNCFFTLVHIAWSAIISTSFLNINSVYYCQNRLR